MNGRKVQRSNSIQRYFEGKKNNIPKDMWDVRNMPTKLTISK